MALKYRLQVLTHGDGQTLEDTLATFREMVEPQPTSVEVMKDDGDLGFCGNTRRSWESATKASEDYVFWLEHDFRFIRPLGLSPLAKTLHRHPFLAQMSLMRDAVNEQEKEAGGVYDFHKASYVKHFDWLEHWICLTTNPSLMRRDFMERNPWPDYPCNCEGLFSADLREAGYSFGTWGSGEVYVNHTGALRTGHSY